MHGEKMEFLRFVYFYKEFLTENKWTSNITKMNSDIAQTHAVPDSYGENRCFDWMID
jgi:hypothetical protein